jgi:putative DNA methylase
VAERKKKLIEVGLPLETINAESAREKSIRHGHPSTLHLWWSRKPTATARAVLFAQLVDDPSSRPEEFPTQEAQDAERARLHELIEALVKWENTAPDAQGIPLPSQGRTVSSQQLFAMAQEEIRESNGGTLPAVLDPFAGGGTIPLEAQRLGLEAHASDLNPVAVLINKALIEIPPKFAGRPPVHPGAEDRVGGWPRATGLAEDVRYYGQWMRDEAFRRIGHLYPKVTGPDGKEHTVIAWKWARTVKSPNPANPIEVPLVSSWWLGKKKGKEAWIKAEAVDGQVRYTVQHNVYGPKGGADGTVSRTGAISMADGTPISLDYVREEARAGRMGAHLIAVVAEGDRERLYLSPSWDQAMAADVDRPSHAPGQELPDAALGFRVQNYGMTHWSDLFTNRQLVAMTTFSDLVKATRYQVLADCADPEYSDAVSTYLALAVDRVADLSNSMCSWVSAGEFAAHMFTRQAISMIWDYAETNPLAEAGGNISGQVDWVTRVLERLPASAPGLAQQADASLRPYQAVVVSTDPPYYDNIGYADLSDFFYIWLRRALGGSLDDLMGTVLTPKTDELVANPFRHGDHQGAEEFFVRGFNSVFRKIRASATSLVPLAVYYAYKQQDSGTDGTTSTGWHTLLDGLVQAGWEITATWPVRSERPGRMRDLHSNALASSIVLACRPRPEDAPAITARRFLDLLRLELPGALRAMIRSDIAPVDLAQAAIGPGMSIFSRYSRVREADGSDMSVRDALLLINQTLDEVIDEQEADFDPDTRFAVKWYRQYAWGVESSGIADQLSRSTDTSVGALERGGIFEAKGGKARLLSPKELTGEWDVENDERVSIWEALVRLAAVMEKQGADQVAALLPAVGSKVSLDNVKELGVMLFHYAEKKGDAQDALLFNGLVTAWSDVTSQARRLATAAPRVEQPTLDFEQGES